MVAAVVARIDQCYVSEHKIELFLHLFIRRANFDQQHQRFAHVFARFFFFVFFCSVFDLVFFDVAILLLSRFHRIFIHFNDIFCSTSQLLLMPITSLDASNCLCVEFELSISSATDSKIVMTRKIKTCDCIAVHVHYARPALFHLAV